MTEPTKNRFAACLIVLLFGINLMATAGLALWMVLSEPTSSAAADPPRPPPLPPVQPRADLTELEQTTMELFSRHSASVVFITSVEVRHDPFRRNLLEIPRGTGSGFVWDQDGHIVTNYHVVQGASAARVTLSDQSVWDARLVGRAAHKDLAVLEVDAPADRLHPLPIGTSRDLSVGQYVLAIGNPFGLDQTLSTGVISGVGREIQSATGRPITGVVQTDAAINPGNSGGPLLDSSGRLIGVNTAIYSPTGTSAGVGFAVPVDTVSRIVPQLIEHGREIRPTLGVQIAESHVARRFGVDSGVLLLGVVAGSGAERAGLVPTRMDPRNGTVALGDVIKAVDGEAIEEPDDLFRVLDTKRVGQTVVVGVLRGNGRVDVRVTLGASADE